jgi:hypothetical protein
MRLPLARRVAAAALLLAWSAALIQEAASLEAPARKQSGSSLKVLVARKVSPPGGGVLRREPIPAEPALDSAPAPTIGVRVDLTQPAYLRAFSSGTPHGHRDPPG